MSDLSNSDKGSPTLFPNRQHDDCRYALDNSDSSVSKGEETNPQMEITHAAAAPAAAAVEAMDSEEEEEADDNEGFFDAVSANVSAIAYQQQQQPQQHEIPSSADTPSASCAVAAADALCDELEMASDSDGGVDGARGRAAAVAIHYHDDDGVDSSGNMRLGSSSNSSNSSSYLDSRAGHVSTTAHIRHNTTKSASKNSDGTDHVNERTDDTIVGRTFAAAAVVGRREGFHSKRDSNENSDDGGAETYDADSHYDVEDLEREEEEEEDNDNYNDNDEEDEEDEDDDDEDGGRRTEEVARELLRMNSFCRTPADADEEEARGELSDGSSGHRDDFEVTCRAADSGDSNSSKSKSNNNNKTQSAGYDHSTHSGRGGSGASGFIRHGSAGGKLCGDSCTEDDHFDSNSNSNIKTHGHGGAFTAAAVAALDAADVSEVSRHKGLREPFSSSSNFSSATAASAAAAASAATTTVQDLRSRIETVDAQLGSLLLSDRRGGAEGGGSGSGGGAGLCHTRTITNTTSPSSLSCEGIEARAAANGSLLGIAAAVATTTGDAVGDQSGLVEDREEARRARAVLGMSVPPVPSRGHSPGGVAAAAAAVAAPASPTAVSNTKKPRGLVDSDGKRRGTSTTTSPSASRESQRLSSLRGVGAVEDDGDAVGRNVRRDIVRDLATNAASRTRIASLPPPPPSPSPPRSVLHHSSYSTRQQWGVPATTAAAAVIASNQTVLALHRGGSSSSGRGGDDESGLVTASGAADTGAAAAHAIEHSPLPSSPREESPPARHVPPPPPSIHNDSDADDADDDVNVNDNHNNSENHAEAEAGSACGEEDEREEGVSAADSKDAHAPAAAVVAAIEEGEEEEEQGGDDALANMTATTIVATTVLESVPRDDGDGGVFGVNDVVNASGERDEDDGMQPPPPPPPPPRRRRPLPPPPPSPSPVREATVGAETTFTTESEEGRGSRMAEHSVPLAPSAGRGESAGHRCDSRQRSATPTSLPTAFQAPLTHDHFGTLRSSGGSSDNNTDAGKNKNSNPHDNSGTGANTTTGTTTTTAATNHNDASNGPRSSLSPHCDATNSVASSPSFSRATPFQVTLATPLDAAAALLHASPGDNALTAAVCAAKMAARLGRGGAANEHAKANDCQEEVEAAYTTVVVAPFCLRSAKSRQRSPLFSVAESYLHVGASPSRSPQQQQQQQCQEEEFSAYPLRPARAQSTAHAVAPSALSVAAATADAAVTTMTVTTGANENAVSPTMTAERNGYHGEDHNDSDETEATAENAPRELATGAAAKTIKAQRTRASNVNSDREAISFSPSPLLPRLSNDDDMSGDREEEEEADSAAEQYLLSPAQGTRDANKSHNNNSGMVASEAGSLYAALRRDTQVASASPAMVARGSDSGASGGSEVSMHNRHVKKDGEKSKKEVQAQCVVVEANDASNNARARLIGNNQSPPPPTPENSPIAPVPGGAHGDHSQIHPSTTNNDSAMRINAQSSTLFWEAVDGTETDNRASHPNCLAHTRAADDDSSQSHADDQNDTPTDGNSENHTPHASSAADAMPRDDIIDGLRDALYREQAASAALSAELATTRARLAAAEAWADELAAALAEAKAAGAAQQAVLDRLGLRPPFSAELLGRATRVLHDIRRTPAESGGGEDGGNGKGNNGEEEGEQLRKRENEEEKENAPVAGALNLSKEKTSAGAGAALAPASANRRVSAEGSLLKALRRQHMQQQQQQGATTTNV